MRVPSRNPSGPKIIFATEVAREEGGEVRVIKLTEWLKGRGVDPSEDYDDEVMYLTFRHPQAFKVWQREETVECYMVHCLVTGQDGDLIKFQPLIGVQTGQGQPGIKHVPLDPSVQGRLVGEVVMSY